MRFLKEFLEHASEWRGYPNHIVGKYCPFDLQPYEYLDFAERDLKSGEPHAAANSVLNTKKALELQIDCFLIDYGLEHLSKVWGTAKKIELVGDIAILRPSILKKVNDLRNKIEHQYVIPSIADAENAIEIVDLFLGATDGLLSPVREGTLYERANSDANEKIQLYMNRFRNTISATYFRDGEEQEYFGASCDSLMPTLLKQKDEIARARLNTYLLLLTIAIHCHRLDSKQPEKFFQSSKYVKLLMHSSQLDEP